MAELAVLAVVVVADGGAKPENTPNLDFDTGVELIACDPVEGAQQDTGSGLANARG